MDSFKKYYLKDKSWELSYSRERGKDKLQKETKKILNKTVRKRMKNNDKNLLFSLELNTNKDK